MMNETNISQRRGFSAIANREGKTKKILKIVGELTNHPSKKALLLDIGTGNGGISHFLSQEFEVISVDIEDQRSLKKGYAFLITNELLPFSDECFDVVVSNHVIEHVVKQELHISEIARVLKPGGIAYLATPNRLWPWEVHYQLPLLHYLPQRIFMFLLKRMKKYQEDLRLITWHQLKKLATPYFKVHLRSDRVCKFPNDYYLNAPKLYTSILRLLPLKILSSLAFIHPTFIVILEKNQ